MESNFHYTITGNGRPLLLIHGWAMHRGVWDSLATALAAYRRVIAIDLRGHGAARSLPGPYDIATFAHDVQRFAKELNLRHVIAIGWSLGVSVLFHLMQQPQAWLDALVCISGTPCFVSRDGYAAGLPRVAVQRLQRQISRHYPDALASFHKLLLTEHEQATFAQSTAYSLLVHPRYAPAYEAADQSLQSLADADFRQMIDTISLPTLIVHGSADRLCPAAAADFLHRRIRGARLLLLPETGHVPFLTREPDVVAAILDFLRSLS